MLPAYLRGTEEPDGTPSRQAGAGVDFQWLAVWLHQEHHSMCQSPIAGVAVPFRPLGQPQSRSKGLQPTAVGTLGNVSPLKHRAAPDANHTTALLRSFCRDCTAAPQPPQWPYGEVSFPALSGCTLRAEKAVETGGGPIIATRLLLRPDTPKHDAGSELETNQGGQSHPQFCRRLQHCGTVGMACMKTGWLSRYVLP